MVTRKGHKGGEGMTSRGNKAEQNLGNMQNDKGRYHTGQVEVTWRFGTRRDNLTQGDGEINVAGGYAARRKEVETTRTPASLKGENDLQLMKGIKLNPRAMEA